ncbi:MAG: SBBP repeat-containing protein [Acidobacteriota bacterium]
MTLATNRVIAPLVVCLAVGILVSNIGMAQSPENSQSSAPQIAPPTSPLDPRSGISPESKASLISPLESVHPSLAQLKKAAPSTAIFIENLGQFDSRVRYQVKIGEQTAWLTTDGLVFDATRLQESEKVGVMSESGALVNALAPISPSIALDLAKPPSRTVGRLVFTEDFVKGSCCSKVEAKEPRQGTYNYFQSSDPAKWRANVHGYSEVVYRDIWPGVDLRIYGKGLDLEQELIIQPGADLGKVEIAYRGIEKLNIAGDGSLEVDTAFGKLRETSPVIYQEIAGKRETVSGRFNLRTSTSYGFQVDSYKPEYALVVDPTLLYSTFLGGSAGDYAWNVFNTYFGYMLGEYAAGIAVDASGNAYVAGYTASTDFPITTGAFQVSGSGGFVTKLNATGSALVYSTYLGPSISAVAVDSAGSVYVTGGGAGPTFPTTSSAYYPTDTSHHCNQDLFLAVLNSTGDKLTYSTCFGASAANPSALAVDSGGRAFIAGSVSGTVPTTSNAYQTSYPGVGSAAFVTVIDTTASGASSLLYSTYLGISGTGGAQGAYAKGVTVDSFGKLYVAGSTTDGFPVTAGAFQTAHKGDNSCYVRCEYSPCPAPSCHDAFIAKLDPLASSGVSSLIYSTYLGGIGEDSANGIAVDATGNAYVAGANYYGDLPVTLGAFQTAGPPGYASSAFVAKLSPGGSALVYSTYLRNATTSGNSTGNAIGLDSLGDAYITGTTAANFPVTPDAFQGANAGSTDVFLTKLNATGSSLLYSSYLGGAGNDVANAIAVDPAGDAYVTGYTESPTFPVTPFAFQPVLNPNPLPSNCGGRTSGCHGGDAFVTKFPLGASQTLSISSLIPSSGGNTGTVSPQIFGTGFHAGAVVTLTANGVPDLVASVSNVGTEGRTITAAFDLTGSAPGLRDVVVTSPDGTSATLHNGFTVAQSGKADVWVDFAGWSTLRGGVTEIYCIVSGNRGNVDAQTTRIWVSFPSYITWDAPGKAPSATGVMNGLEYLAFDVSPPAGASVSIPIRLTAPNDRAYAHQIFQVSVWKEGK